MSEAVLSEFIEQARKTLYGIGVNSTNRVYVLVELLEKAENAFGRGAAEFWKVFEIGWSGCDDTWEVQSYLQDLIRLGSPGTPYFDKDQRSFYDALPDQFNIYRGCSRDRIEALSWTYSIDVAKSFVKGHRGIVVPDPVVAVATISKQDVATVLTGRDEQEIIWVPDAAKIDVLEVTEVAQN